jgi:hypothetical protein
MMREKVPFSKTSALLYSSGAAAQISSVSSNQRSVASLIGSLLAGYGRLKFLVLCFGCFGLSMFRTKDVSDGRSSTGGYFLKKIVAEHSRWVPAMPNRRKPTWYGKRVSDMFFVSGSASDVTEFLCFVPSP